MVLLQRKPYSPDSRVDREQGVLLAQFACGFPSPTQSHFCLKCHFSEQKLSAPGFASAGHGCLCEKHDGQGRQPRWGECTVTRYTRLINSPYHEQRRGRVSGSLCKTVEGYESSNQALWLCWCSAVGARLNSAWEMEQKLVAPGHCYLKGAGR